MEKAHSKKRKASAEIEAKKRQLDGEERPWPDLLPELVFSIVESLSLVDRFNVSFVFPEWKPTMRRVPSMPFLLQIAICESNYSTFRIREPTSKTGDLIKVGRLPCLVSLLSSNYGWLLLTDFLSNSVFFFNPLSMAIIRLPHIKTPYSLIACFSAPPTCPECIVFLCEYGADAIRIMFCCRGDNKWTELRFENQESSNYLSKDWVNSVFYKGKVYCSRKSGRVGVFDPVAKSWAIHGSRELCACCTVGYYVLVQSGDDLFRIWTYHIHFSPRFRVFKLDINDGYRWKETRSLNGRCFFVSLDPSIAFSMEALRGEQDRDKIHFHRFKQPYVEYCCWFEPKWDCPSFE